jgi:N-acetyl-anhydromuramyl-L-alanine amidase AmpD
MLVEHGRSLAAKQGKLKRRKYAYEGVVVHTTGAGPWVRWRKQQAAFASPFEAALHVYSKVSIYSPHFVVCGTSGEVTQLDPVDQHCFHVGSRATRAYRKNVWTSGKDLEWWFNRFPYISSPAGLLDGNLWTKASANALTVGIEVAPPSSGPRDAWSEECWDSLYGLTAWLCHRNDIPRDRYHVFTHSDAHPLERTTESGAPWDPSPSQWTIGLASEKLKLTK